MLDWLLCGLLRIAGAVFCALPPAAAVACGRFVGRLGYWLQPARARIGVRNLQAAFDGAITTREARRVIRACFQQMVAGVCELLRLRAIDRAYVGRYITIDGQQHLDAAVASGRPVILLTGHFGNWELTSIIAALNGFPIVALARLQGRFPRLYRLLIAARESKGNTIIHKGGGLRRLIAALEAGQLVGIVCDQASRQGILVPLFGRPAFFATGPFELARSRGALLVPAFIHRTRGAHHHLVVEPSFALAAGQPAEAAVREGILRFVALLERHVRQDPSHWLWMHKRWKRTPARRAVVLSDGKTGHVKQSLAVVAALRARHPELTHTVIPIRYRHPAGRPAAVACAWLGVGREACLRWALDPKTAAAVLSRYADFVISCGSAVAPVNALWSRRHGATSIVVMNPAPLPAGRFDLVIAPRHDGLRAGPRVVSIDGALAGEMDPEELARAAGRLRADSRFRASGPLRHPVVALLIGGATATRRFPPSLARTLGAQVQTACERLGADCVVTTSRRTGREAERALEETIGASGACRVFLAAGRESLEGTMAGLLGLADLVVVTGDSVSMVSEACASGRPVVVVSLPLEGRRSPSRPDRFVRALASAGQVALSEADTLAEAITRHASGPGPRVPLDNLSRVQAAVARLP